MLVLVRPGPLCFDFLEIIYIVIPIVGPGVYGGTFDPNWVTTHDRAVENLTTVVS